MASPSNHTASCASRRPEEGTSKHIFGKVIATNLCLQSHFATPLPVGTRLESELARLQVALHLVQVEQLHAALVGAGQGHQAHQVVQGNVGRVHHRLLEFKFSQSPVEFYTCLHLVHVRRLAVQQSLIEVLTDENDRCKKTEKWLHLQKM